LNTPHGLLVNPRGDIFILDTGNNRVRILTDTATIHDRIKNLKTNYIAYNYLLENILSALKISNYRKKIYKN